MMDENLLLRSALRTIAEDAHNEVARLKRCGRIDLETISSWHKLADQVLLTVSDDLRDLAQKAVDRQSKPEQDVKQWAENLMNDVMRKQGI